MNYPKPKRILTDEQLFGVSKWQLCHPEDRPKVRQQIIQIASRFAREIIPYWTWFDLLGSEMICNRIIDYRPLTVEELRTFLPLSRYVQDDPVTNKSSQIEESMMAFEMKVIDVLKTTEYIEITT